MKMRSSDNSSVRRGNGWSLGISMAALGSCVCLFLLLNGCSGLKMDRTFKMNNEDWLTYGGSAARTNESNSDLKGAATRQWQYDSRAGISATPLVADSVMIVGTLQGELHAVNMSDGKRFGYIVTEGSIVGTPVWRNGIVYVPLASGTETLVSYTLYNGAKYWSAKLGPIETSPIVLDKFIYVTTLKGTLHCMNVGDGKEVWKFDTQQEEKRKPIRSSPASDGETIVFGCDDGAIYAVDQGSGLLKWKFQTRESVVATPIVVGGRIVVGSLDGTVYCLDARKGTLCWRYQTHSRLYASASTNRSLVFVGSTDEFLYAIDLQNGSLVWKFKAHSVINSAPLVAKNRLYVCSLDKNLYALDLMTGKELWRIPADGRIRVSPVLWRGMLLLTSEDRVVTAYR
jgi:outer membrane protein assembly factor BamB